MKIISKFSDYYDHVSKIYGGGDPKIIYNRKEIGEKVEDSMSFVNNGKSFNIKCVGNDIPLERDFTFSDKTFEFKILVVCGIGYLLIRIINTHDSLHEEKYKVFNDSHLGIIAIKLKEELKDGKHRKYYWHRYWAQYQFDEKTYKEILKKLKSNEKYFLMISRIIQHPVFIICGRDVKNETVKIEGRCPILKDLDFQKIMTPEKLYQDLSYFVGNIIHESPDVIPPIEVEDKYKITQHGFDLKTSFRKGKE